jgi:G3E family GTPase
MDRQITFTVIGGFLGAGKTSLVNRVLAGGGDTRFAVLVNDFGALNIDRSLVESRNERIIQLSNGCICCSLAGGLVDAMVSLMAWRDRIDHILIEASGVSYPGRIMDFARIDPDLRPGLTLVLVDAASMPDQINDPRLAEVIAAQMQDADMFLLTKTDIASDDEVIRTHDYLATHQAQAPVVTARADDPDIIALLLSDDAGAFPDMSSPDMSSPDMSSPDMSSRDIPDPKRLSNGGHSADRTSAEDHRPLAGFVSAAMSATTPIDAAAFRAVCSAHSRLLVRGKGFVRFAEGTHVWQQSGRRTEFHPAGQAAPTGSRIVLIATDPLDQAVAGFAALGFQPLAAGPDPISSAR